MFIGGYISAAGLGLTCPEWPLCPNGLLPNDEFLVEWIHRFVAATTSVLVAVTAVFSWRSPNSNSKIRFTSAFACGLIVVQISLGALVIDTLLHAVLVAVHLGLGILLFAMTLLTTLFAFRIDVRAPVQRSNLQICEAQGMH